MSASPKTISRITTGATFIKVSPAFVENNNQNSQNIINKLFKFIILIEAFIGINRLYLLTNNKIISISFHVISIIYVLLFIFFLFVQNIYQDYFIINDGILIFEFAVLIYCSNFLQKKKLTKMFGYLAMFDEKLRICNDVHILTSPKISVFVIISSLLYYAVETLLIWIFVPQVKMFTLFVSFIIFVHVTEQVFFCISMKAIYKRLSVLKAHVGKILHKVEKRNKVDALCENVHLDIEDMHKAYELLHRCGKNLNSAMNIPVITYFILFQFCFICKNR